MIGDKKRCDQDKSCSEKPNLLLKNEGVYP